MSLRRGFSMDAREQRGLAIAALVKLTKKDGEWVVPSQSEHDRNYRVDVKNQTCSCPDHKENNHKCKHIWACEITIKRETNRDGIVTETKTISFMEKKTYKQDWPSYNAAQSVEKDRLQELLADLVRGIPEPTREESRRGRKPHSVHNSLFAA